MKTAAALPARARLRLVSPEERSPGGAGHGSGRSFPSRTGNGFLVVYYDETGAEPTWSVPELDLAGWRPILTRRWQVRTHPQETGEGSVDLGHLRNVHQYLSAEPVTPLTPDG